MLQCIGETCTIHIASVLRIAARLRSEVGLHCPFSCGCVVTVKSRQRIPFHFFGNCTSVMASKSDMLSVVRPVLQGQLFRSLPYPPVPLCLFAVRCVCGCVFPLLLSMCMTIVQVWLCLCQLPEWLTYPLSDTPACRSLAPCADCVAFAPAVGAYPEG